MASRDRVSQGDQSPVTEQPDSFPDREGFVQSAEPLVPEPMVALPRATALQDSLRDREGVVQSVERPDQAPLVGQRREKVRLHLNLGLEAVLQLAESPELDRSACPRLETGHQGSIPDREEFLGSVPQVLVRLATGHPEQA